MKINIPIITRLLTALGIAGMISAANAQSFTNLIFGTDFEASGTNDNSLGAGGYGYAGSSTQIPANVGFSGGAITAGVGLTNSAGLPGYPDYTGLATDPNYSAAGLDYTFAGVSLGVNFGPPLTPITPTADLDSYIVSFDAMVGGLLPGQNNTTLTFGPSQFDGTLNFTTAGAITFRFLSPGYTVGSNFTHAEIPLSAFSLYSGNANDLTNPAVMGAIDGFTVDIRALDQVGTIGVDRSPVFGFDNDNTVVIDNLYLRQVTNAAPPLVLPKYESLLWQVNFDDQQPDNTYGINFRDNGAPNTATTTVVTNATSGVGGSAALDGTADLSSWAATPPTLFSGFGPGVGHGIPYTLQNTNKSGYRVYWTAKAGGFLDGITQASGNASIEFIAGGAVMLELVPNITLSSDYTSFVFEGASAAVGQFNGGSLAQFNTNISRIDQIDVRFQFNAPNVGTIFGYDADNTVTVDNIKVVELATGIPAVSVAATNGQVKVFWADPYNVGTAKLQSSTNVAGPYLDVAGAASGAASPYTVPTGNSQKFFRTQWVP